MQAEINESRGQLVLPGTLVKKSNAIARAQWQPKSLWEPRIVALVAAKVRSDDTDFQTYKIPVSDLKHDGDSKANLSGKQYQEIVKAIANLGGAVIRMRSDTKKNNLQNFRQYNIFAMIGYENGCLIAQFHPDLKPHFLQLKEQFTSYNLIEYLALPSLYSQQLFDILKSWGGLDTKVIHLADLHETLMTPKHMRENFKDFRVRVLEKAKNDIDAKTMFNFEWEAIKEGRAVVAIRFIFNDKMIEEIQKKKASTAKSKKAASETANAMLAYQCAEKKNFICPNKDNKKSICMMCEAMGYLQEMAQ